MPRPVYEFGPFTADPEMRVLMREGKVVPIPPKAFDVLLTLIRSDGAPVTRDELMQEVCGNTFVEEGSITIAIWMLRKVLGDDSRCGARFILTAPKRGYRFALPLQQADPSSDIEVEDRGYGGSHNRSGRSTGRPRLESANEPESDQDQLEV